MNAEAAWRDGQPFPETSWGLVQAACTAGAGGGGAFAELYRRYRLPIYASLRHQGFDIDRAQDLAQDFFIALIEDETVRRADAERGRFRSFLLGALRRFLARSLTREHARKRGRDYRLEPFDAEAMEARLGFDPAPDLELEFDRAWARALIATTLAALESEEAAARRAGFALLRPCLDPGATPPSRAELARQLDCSEGAVKTAVHRLRRRFREILRREVAATLASPDAVDDELRHLRDVLAARPEAP